MIAALHSRPAALRGRPFWSAGDRQARDVAAAGPASLAARSFRLGRTCRAAGLGRKKPERFPFLPGGAGLATSSLGQKAPGQQNADLHLERRKLSQCR